MGASRTAPAPAAKASAEAATTTHVSVPEDGAGAGAAVRGADGIERWLSIGIAPAAEALARTAIAVRRATMVFMAATLRARPSRHMGQMTYIEPRGDVFLR